MQFITIMMITEITSTAAYLVLIPAKSSSLTGVFNADPRWGVGVVILLLWKHFLRRIR